MYWVCGKVKINRLVWLIWGVVFNKSPHDGENEDFDLCIIAQLVVETLFIASFDRPVKRNVSTDKQGFYGVVCLVVQTRVLIWASIPIFYRFFYSVDTRPTTFASLFFCYPTIVNPKPFFNHRPWTIDHGLFTKIHELYASTGNYLKDTRHGFKQ